MQTTATPTPDGKGYVLNGEKRWITNGGIAQVLTVMARTPVPGSKETQDHGVPGDARHARLRGRRKADAQVRRARHGHGAAGVHDMFVPNENMLGQLGKGLRSGADGARLRPHDVRRQLHRRGQVLRRAGHAARADRACSSAQPLATFEMVKEKLAYMQAGMFAMEAATYETAALIDAGEGDYMLETAMLKVFSTDVLWRIINDTIQIFGGKAYFTDEPYERMMRDARINMIGEGANDVLRVFIALVGMARRRPGAEGRAGSGQTPAGQPGQARPVRRPQTRVVFQLARRSTCMHSELEWDAMRLGKLIGFFGSQVEAVLRRYQESILDRQYQLARIADSANELYASALRAAAARRAARRSARMDARSKLELQTGRYYLTTADGAFTTIWTICGSTTTKRRRPWPMPC